MTTDTDTVTVPRGSEAAAPAPMPATSADVERLEAKVDQLLAAVDEAREGLSAIGPVVASLQAHPMIGRLFSGVQ